ncbi:uncharacterized protein RHOBADRAFT_43665 [Rhodotorula graminis WP1]|uniref:Carboxylesterase type B domain-containing protein n=1 Tax=Rhodotorula graminis (strain WP1) TaxID=578459 RepID=A0A194S366_RHOGW|nr:uncharacterized protein RHOBADRAFT_43665 [Rhodotorula graminis WP1]KPV75178.1 hypothetical protein RHOBADRAFT_43665 [Rhodotorula graminis WP1]
MVLSSCIARFCAAAPLLGLLAASCKAAPVLDSVVSLNKSISTPHGKVVGSVADNVVRYTVPYAQPPVGDLRWKAASAIGPWNNVDGTQLPQACTQYDVSNTNIIGSEDCLFMNVYAPADAAATAALPVMVWLHGGSFLQGSPSDLDEGARSLASQQRVVVVTVQYRLGIFGFLGYYGYAGNQGLTDVIQALTFVKSDLKAYGADPSQVTLAGQSSGAEMVKTLLVTDAADSLFSRAILQSAPLDYPDQSYATAAELSKYIYKSLNCPDRRVWPCIRQQSVEKMMAVQSDVQQLASVGQWASRSDFAFAEPFRIIIDGRIVTKDFRKVVASGQPLNVPSRPVISSTVKDEGCNGVQKVLSQPLPASFWPTNAPGIVASFFTNRAGDILASGKYDPSNIPDDADAFRNEFIQLTTDFTWVCPTQQTALNSTAASGYRGNVYLAEFDVGISKHAEGENDYCAGGVGHEDDIKLLFRKDVSTSVQGAVSSDVQARWGSFIRTGNPNRAAASLGLVNWPPVAASAGDLNVLVLGADASTGKSAVKKSQRDDICKIGSGLYSPR